MNFRSPDTSKVRMKMVYASSKDRFKRELDGIQVELQATDPSEMSFDIIKSRALWISSYPSSASLQCCCIFSVFPIWLCSSHTLIFVLWCNTILPYSVCCNSLNSISVNCISLAWSFVDILLFSPKWNIRPWSHAFQLSVTPISIVLLARKRHKKFYPGLTSIITWLILYKYPSEYTHTVLY